MNELAQTPARRAYERDADGRVLLKGMTNGELRAWVIEELGERPFRADQLWRWLYTRYAASFDEMTDLSKAVRAKLAEMARVDVLEEHGRAVAEDGTTKLLWKTLSGGVVESVLIPSEGRNTLCISSQVGCAMNCQFCLTAKMGLNGNLKTAEIVDQVVRARRMFQDDFRVSNVVFMGMGEPLHNPNAVIPATEILIDREGLDFSHRKVTVSTSGLVPEIRRFGAESRAKLAVSLNATTDEVRDWIMPINRRYPLDVLLGALREFPLDPHERITFEYVMLKDVNDSWEDARRLVRLVSNIPCKINLIPFNPHPGTEFVPSSHDHVEAFREFLLSKHLQVTIRETRGGEQMAACGQLGQPGPKMPKRLEPPEKYRGVIES
jgi:23S rRNA (adenine2503-C2)-methyltransferase